MSKKIFFSRFKHTQRLKNIGHAKELVHFTTNHEIKDCASKKFQDLSSNNIRDASGFQTLNADQMDQKNILCKIKKHNTIEKIEEELNEYKKSNNTANKIRIIYLSM